MMYIANIFLFGLFSTMMKGLKWGIIGLLAGQALGVFMSRPELKQKFIQAQGADKLKLVFDELVGFNQSLLESVDLSHIRSDLAFRIEHLQDEVSQLTQNWSTINHDKLQQWMSYLKTTVDQLKGDVTEYVSDLDDRHQLSEKLSVLKNHINELQHKLAENPLQE